MINAESPFAISIITKIRIFDAHLACGVFCCQDSLVEEEGDNFGIQIQDIDA